MAAVVWGPIIGADGREGWAQPYQEFIWEIPVKMKTERSQKLFEQALKYLPGGVGSPVRAFGAVCGGPLFMERGRGSRIYDADGNEHLDYVLSWRPPILGHAHPQVVASLRAAAARGTSFGAPTELETMLARLITAALPSIELISYDGGKDYVERK